MSPLTSSKHLLPEAGNLLPLGIYQLHGVIHEVSGKDVKVIISGGVNNWSEWLACAVTELSVHY